VAITKTHASSLLTAPTANERAMEYETMKILIGLVTGLIIIATTQSVLAQQSNLTLSETWEDGKGFTSFEWLRAENKRELYSSAVYIEVNRNTLNIYNTYKLDPFGKYARCGGLGCDLGRGGLVTTLNFESRGNLFTVQSATGKAGFLKGAQCRIMRSYLKILECISFQNPAGVNMSSIFRFSPGT
jgi:hypothetical protein